VTAPESIVVAVCADLMDRSKISAALPDATLVRSLHAAQAELSDAATDAEHTVFVDLRRVDEIGDLADLASQAIVIAFGSHVDDAALAAATDAGAAALPRSLFFRRLNEGSLLS